MKQILDLHIHSSYSRGTSKNSTLEGLYKWGKIKGISIIGTGDFTHPVWFSEIREKLEPAEFGLFKLKEEIASKIDKELPFSIRNKDIRFILSVEISNIYSKNERVRKVHNLIVVPDFVTVSALNDQFSRIGNIKSDGRPILGVDCKNLLSIVLNINPQALFIPAHVWTPWFSLFGSKSGFDRIEEAFDELTPEIKSIETGLSSDPFMNWRLSFLDNLTIISNSDAHSPEKIGREATILNCDLNYLDIRDAIYSNNQKLIGTIEFFPQEGKYHYDGHRACNVRFSPQETKKMGGVCPVCLKPLTIGVDYRVSELSDRPFEYRPQIHKSVEYIIPLIEIIAEVKKSTVGSKTVWEIYHRLISSFGSEFEILREIAIKDIEKSGFSEYSLAIEKMRKGDVYINPGFDGVYGTISIFKPEDKTTPYCGQMTFLK